ncbi:MAG: acyl-ACP thioesterase domain-containing protein [Rhodothermales bacterium]
MPPIPPVWRDAFRVRAYEIDPAGRLTLPTLCNYFQETAGNHATAFDLASDQLLAGGIAWVLARLQVEVERYPAWREDVTVETWPSAFDGLYAQRDFVATDEHGETIARATSQWFVMDVARRRPIRLPAAVAEIERPDRPHALDPDRTPLPDFGEPDAERLFSVRRHDLDLNQHVNNVRYVEWALEAVPDAVRDAHTLRRLDVHFRAESVYGDTVRSACSPPEPSGDGVALAHEVTRHRDGRLLARARTAWR